MTYQIYYTTDKDRDERHCLFDIEYYMIQDNKKEWYSEISSLPIVDGITLFLRDRFKEDDFDHEQFIKDSKEIQELRGLLYEKYGNRPSLMDDADRFHYWFCKIIKQKIDIFCEKYNLCLNID